jgi:acyl carrier protein
MKHEEISKKLKEHVARHVLNGKDVGLDEQTPLLEWGILNSIEIMRLLTFIKDAFHVHISPSKLVANNFSTIDAIAKMVVDGIADVSASA